MALPQSIQQQAEYADAIERKFDGISNKDVQEGVKDAQPDPEHDQPVVEEGGKPSEVDQAEVEKLRSRYSSLQGKYNSEVPRLSARNKELERELERLAKDNEKLRMEKAEQLASTKYLTDRDTEEFGGDMVDLVRRGAQEVAAKYEQEAAKLRNELDILRSQLAGAQKQHEADANGRFYATLERECPNWETQDKDPGFIAWLSEADPVLGISRQEALDRAAGLRDASRVAAIFNQYKTQTQQKAGDNPLARQVAPAKSSGSSGYTQTARRWTQADIASFYEACRLGEVTSEQKRQIEQEIDNAVATGQVTA